MAAPQSRDPQYTTTAEALKREALADQSAFVAKYKGEFVEVDGKLQDASVALTPDGFSLVGAKKKPDDIIGLTVYCILPADERLKALALGRGQRVKVVGVVTGANSLAVYLDRCSFSELEPTSIPMVTAESLAAEFAGDERAAETKYRLYAPPYRAELLISGTVVDLTSESNGSGTIHSIFLAGADGIVINVTFADNMALSAGLKIGDKVTVKGDVYFYWREKRRVNVSLSSVTKQP